jgi:peptidyl-prolyl cis-trans isomerase SurA
MRKNPGYKVEIAGHSDLNEDEKVAEVRIKGIVDFLIENGLPLMRIMEVNFKNTKPGDRFDWSKNQRVNFQFFSDLDKDLMKGFNELSPNAITFSEQVLSKENFGTRYTIPWKTGTYTQKTLDTIKEIDLEIKNVPYTFKAYKSETLEKYQASLKTELLRNLKAKYKISAQRDEIKKAIDELKNQNR